jgi:hypothetical protein
MSKLLASPGNPRIACPDPLGCDPGLFIFDPFGVWGHSPFSILHLNISPAQPL